MKKIDRGPIVVRPPGSSVPIPVGKDTDIVRKAQTCLETVANDLYTGDDPRFENKSRLEAAILSLADDATISADARTEFLDRILGKPKQRVDTTSITMDLTSFLQQLAEEDKQTETESDGEVKTHDVEYRISDIPETEKPVSILRGEMPENKDENGGDPTLCFQ